MDCYEYEKHCGEEWVKDHPEIQFTLTEKDAYGGDGGVDLIFLEQNGKKIYGQCKHYNSEGAIKEIPVRQIRELKGAMARDNIQKGIFFSPINFSQKSWKEAKLDNIWIKKTNF